MKLRALTVSNFACIGQDGVTVPIDDIVILIGPNNSGKSAILDAYEAFASTGGAIELKYFRDENPANHVAISGIFVDITSEDTDIIGAKWKHEDPKYGECIKVKWEWLAPDQKGQKYSWDPKNADWVPGGMGGWDTLITSRIPHPLRVKPTDDPDKSEAQIVDILTAVVKTALKKDKEKAAKVLGELKALADEFAKEAQKELDDACSKITQKLSAVFPDHQVQFQPEVGKIDADKIIGAGSHIRIKEPERKPVPLSQQGAGMRRTFLWSALGTLAEIGRVKQRQKKIGSERCRILLIEEPESFLHPPMVRGAREALYGLAEVAGWQSLISTHSPVFIDVSKSHTTIIRIEKESYGTPRVFCSDKAKFTNDERLQLRMIRSCHPTVSEFFFADHVLLVEGETELAVLTDRLAPDEQDRQTTHHIVNCMGKANLPLFARILNQFGTPYTIIHDADSPKAMRKDKWIINPMWTLNAEIVKVVADRSADLPACRLVVHIPDFEGYYFKLKLGRDKPYQVVKIINSPEFQTSEDYAELRDIIALIAEERHPGLYSSFEELQKRVSKWAEETNPKPADAWDLS